MAEGRQYIGWRVKKTQKRVLYGASALARKLPPTLLQRHADPNARDYSNTSALYYAQINEHAEIAALLKKFGAKD